MSLVAYGDSDQSDDEAEQDEQIDDVNIGQATNSTATISDPLSVETSPLFSKLPAPQNTSTTVLDPSLQEIVKQPAKTAKSKRAQILIPSLDEWDDDEDEEQQKKKIKRAAQTGSGLMGLLPAPRHGSTTSVQLTPQVLTRPRTVPNKVPQTSAPSTTPPTMVAETRASQAWSEDPDEPGGLNQSGSSAPSFFTFGETPLPQPEPPVEGYSIPTTETYTPDVPQVDALHTVQREPTPESRRGKIVFAEPAEPGTSAFDVELDDGALVRLRGRRQEEINIIDVSADSQVDKSRILIRGLTEEQPQQSHSDNSDFNTSQQHRRKHQITYLAQQAKAREQELKNMWSQNRMTRRQTQAKYGF